MRAYALFSVMLFAVACGGGAPEPASPTGGGAGAGAGFADEARAFFEAELAFWPHRAAARGHFDRAGALPDRSPGAVAAEIARLEGALETFGGFEDEALTATERAERDAVIARARRGLVELEVMRVVERDPIEPLRAVDLSPYADAPNAPAGERARAAMEICAGAEAFFEGALARLSDDVPRPWLDAAWEMADASIDYVRGDVAAALGGAAELGDGVKVSLERCAAALEHYRDGLDARRDGAPEAFSLGADALAELFFAEGLGADLEAIRTAVEDGLERDRAALAEAAAAVDPDLSVAEVVAFERMNKPEIDEVVAVAEHHVEEVRELAQAWPIVPSPRGVEVEVGEAPPLLRDRAASARVWGARDGEAPRARVYVSPPHASWPDDERRGYVLAIGDLVVASIREAWPGRLVHELAAASSGSEILAAYCSRAARDGWAHYAERVMWEAGLADGEPRVHVALLASSLLHHLRALTAIDVHAGGLTVAEAAARFEREAFVDPATARAEARRALYDPGYASSSVGRLAIETRRRAWKAEGGGLRAFHDELLARPCAPLLP